MGLRICNGLATTARTPSSRGRASDQRGHSNHSRRISGGEKRWSCRCVARRMDPTLPTIQFLNHARIPVVGISIQNAKTLRQTSERERSRMRLVAEGSKAESPVTT